MEEKKLLAIQFWLDLARDCLKDEQRKAILNVLDGNHWNIRNKTWFPS